MPLDFLRIRRLPFLTRANYLNEFRHIASWSVVVGLVEGSLGSVVVARTFAGSELLISIAVATPMAAFLFSLVWGMACAGRPKVRLMTTLITGVVLLLGTVAAVPASPSGAIWFIAQVAAAQILFAGIVTVRSSVWKSNYPALVRGQIIARLQGVRTVISTLATLSVAGLFDRDPLAYRYIYPVVALFGLVSIIFVRRIRVRGERRDLAADHGLREGMTTPLPLATILSPRRVLGEMAGVLREDRRFAAYLGAQFLLGIANFLPRGVLVVLLTRSLDVGYDRVFWTALVLTDVLPKVLVLASLKSWGRLFDRVGVVRLRVINSLFWAASLVFGLAGTVAAALSGGNAALLPLSLMLLGMYSIAYGLGRGGGALAWNIGHLHFARPEKAEVYMGVHVSLTGFRGLTIPPLGVWLWTVIGWGVWAVALVFVGVAFTMFLSMSRRELRNAEPDPDGRSSDE